MALCDSPRLEFTEAFTLISVLLMVAVLYVTGTFVFYIKADPPTRAAARNRPSKFLTNSGLIFFMVTLISMAAQIVSVFQLCRKGQHDAPFQRFISLMFSLHADVLLLLWYFQIRHILFKTKFKMSRYPTIIFVILFMIVIICTITSMIGKAGKYQLLLGLIAFITYLFQLIFISYLFIYKLYKIYGENEYLLDQNKDKKLAKIIHERIIRRITKMVILYFGGLIMQIITIIIILSVLNKGIIGEFISQFVTILDISKNFLCVILSYSFYDKFYQKICGCFHIKCTETMNNYLCCFGEKTNNKENKNKNENENVQFKEIKKNKNDKRSSKILNKITPKNTSKQVGKQESIHSFPDDTETKETNDDRDKIDGDDDKNGMELLCIRTNSVVEPPLESDNEDNDGLDFEQDVEVMMGTQTAQMEEILNGILEYNDNENDNDNDHYDINLNIANSANSNSTNNYLFRNDTRNTTANNTDNEESEVP